MGCGGQEGTNGVNAMNGVSRRTAPTSDVDLLAPDAIADPHAVFAGLRGLGPVVRLERHRAWLFTDYESVREGFRDERLSSDRLTPIEQRRSPESRAAMERTIELLRGWMVFHDPPDHQRLREPLRRAFTPRRIADLTPRIEAIVDELLADLATAAHDTDDTVDLVERFAFPLPAIVIAELLGVPASDRDEFKQWSDLLAAIVFGASDRGERAERAAAGTDRFADYFGGLIERYTARPEDNLISALIAVTREDPEGVGLTPSELVGACTLLLFGGHETTTNLIGLSVRSLLAHPDQAITFRERPELLVRAMEELHRYDGSTKLMVRIVAEDHDRGGARLRRGDTVFLGVLSANRDPAVYPEPDRLWLERPDARGHLGFGYGTHFCLGAALARLESQLAVRALMTRFPRMTADPDRTGFSGVLVGRGIARLPVDLG